MPFRPAFVYLYLDTGPLTISSSTMRSQATFPPSRFSLSKSLFLWIKPADFSAFVNLVSTCPSTILSSTMRSQATFPPSRFSLSKSLFFINQTSWFFCFCGLLPVHNTGQYVLIDNIVLHNAVTSNVSTFKVWTLKMPFKPAYFSALWTFTY